MTNAKEKGTIKYTMQLDTAGLPTSEVEYICGLVNENDITESLAGQVLSSTFAGIKAGTYKTLCLIRKKGVTDWKDALRCEDGPFSITPNGLDDCKDKIQVTNSIKTSDTPPITFTVNQAPATVTCIGGTLQQPSSPTLSFQGQTTYNVVCKMNAGFTCSAKVVGTGAAIDPEVNPPGGTGGNNT